MTTETAVERSTDARSVPYVAFTTLTNMLDRLAEGPEPTRIDKSVLSYLSGGYQSQLLAGLRGMALIDSVGRPDERLVEMINDADRRPQIVSLIFKEVYGEVFDALDMTRATAGELVEQFKRFKVSGATRDKAVLFFVKGCEFAGIELSSLITDGAKRRAASSRSAKKTTTSKPEEQRDDGLSVNVHPMLSGAIRWLAENGSTWDEEQAKAWCDQFVGSVRLVYPPNTSSSSNGHKPNPAT